MLNHIPSRGAASKNSKKDAAIKKGPYRILGALTNLIQRQDMRLAKAHKGVYPYCVVLVSLFNAAYILSRSIPIHGIFPISGRAFFFPVAAFTIPIIARTNRNIVPPHRLTLHTVKTVGFLVQRP